MSLIDIFKTKTGELATGTERPTPRYAPETSESLEDVLLELSKWGRARVGQYGSNHSGWHCSVEVNVTPVGVKFEAKSESFDHPTPTEAAISCRKNLLNAVKVIGGAA